MKKSSRDKRKRQRSRTLDPAELLREQMMAFEKKFGRPPRPGDSIFFDPDADEPRQLSIEELDHEILSAMRASGIPPQIIYAFKKTGMVLSERLKENYPPEKVTAWEAAIEEYFAMEARSEHSDAAPADEAIPAAPETNIPGLKQMALTMEEKKLVITCLRAVDEHLEKQPTSMRVKTELAAAVLLMGAVSAFESAWVQGSPDEDETRYRVFVDLVVMRTRELFELNHS